MIKFIDRNELFLFAEERENNDYRVHSAIEVKALWRILGRKYSRVAMGVISPEYFASSLVFQIAESEGSERVWRMMAESKRQEAKEVGKTGVTWHRGYLTQ